MSKKANSQKKRRNKQYTGADAASKGVHVTKIKAEPKSALQNWWIDNKVGVLSKLLLAGFIGLVLSVVYLVFALLT